jgi:phosphoribosylformylglycinamidine synthase
MHQANPECVALERDGLKLRTAPPLATTYAPVETPSAWRELSSRPRVAILREEGSNGDREMAAAFTHAGFEAWDVCVRDLAAEGSTVALDAFRGVVFVGGFSYADVLDSAKGWAGGLRFNPTLRAQVRSSFLWLLFLLFLFLFLTVYSFLLCSSIPLPPFAV